jgi:hypothetical protein
VLLMHIGLPGKITPLMYSVITFKPGCVCKVAPQVNLLIMTDGLFSRI